MTNKEKLEKVRAEIERTMNWEKEQAAHSYGNVRLLHECREDVCKKFLSFIDYTQEKSINNGLDLGCGVIWKDVEPASEDFKIALEKKVREAQDWTYIEEEGGECPLNEEFGADDLEEFAMWGANWQKQQMMKEAVSGHVGQTINGMLRALSDETFGDMGFTAGDQVTLIIIKAD